MSYRTGFPDWSRGIYWLGQMEAVWDAKAWSAKIGWWKMLALGTPVAAGGSYSTTLYTVPEGRTYFVTDVFVSLRYEGECMSTFIQFEMPDSTLLQIVAMDLYRAFHHTFSLPIPAPEGSKLTVLLVNRGSSDNYVMIRIFGFEV